MPEPERLRRITFLFVFILGIALTACAVESQPQLTMPQVKEKTQVPSPAPTLEPPVNMLSICVGEEPTSLFLYGDTSPVARAIRQALYDGPVDVLNFGVEPVILAQLPSQANQSVILLPVDVQPGTEIVDQQGHLTYLVPGTEYRPAGCFSAECAQTYPGDGPVTVDQVVVRFELIDNLYWSDGIPLTTADSVYSYQVAKGLFTQFIPDKLRFTQVYWALDENQIEWRGMPGYLGISDFADYFFSPLPQHAWEELTLNELLTTTKTTQRPLGWGPYVLDEWKAGDHISLSKNLHYFEATEIFPYYDHISFRFVQGSEEALAAFLSRECDVVANVDGLIGELDVLRGLERAGELRIVFQEGKAWEQAVFGISSLDSQTKNLFQEKTTRQAIAKCVDREALAEAVEVAGPVANSYIPKAHPLNDLGDGYVFMPQEASQMLEELGWIDGDQNPNTPRLAFDVPGVEDGTPLAFTYYVAGDAVPEEAEIIRESLAQCGVEVTLAAQSAEELFASGLEGPIFGRQFEMAQFAWSIGSESLCRLFITSEIPGHYPEHPKGWGGGNAPGYSNPDFDAACNFALTSLPNTKETIQAHKDALEIFMEDLPVLPLYFRREIIIVRPEVLGPETGIFPLFWNLEAYREISE